MPFEPVYGIPHGRLVAAQTGGGILIPECKEILRDYYRFKEKGARAAFADSWVRITSQQLDKTWVVLYELLNTIKCDRLFENASYMADGKARATFEEYWDQVVEKPFETWAELERVYRFATDNCPELLQRPFEEAREAVLGKRGRPKKVDGKVVSNNINTVSPTSAEYYKARLRRDILPEHNPDAADRQRKAELLAAINEGRIAPSTAAVEAGYRKKPIILPSDPHDAATAILNRFSGEPLLELVRVLANHEGYDIVERENA